MNDKQPTIAQIQSYLNGELDAAAMHQIEKQAQGDPFLMDALEGYELSGVDQQANLNQLKTQLQSRVDQKKKPVMMLWRRVSVAACVLAFLTIGWFWLLKEQPSNKKQTVHVIEPKKQPKADPVTPPASAPQIAAAHAYSRAPLIIRPHTANRSVGVASIPQSGTHQVAAATAATIPQVSKPVLSNSVVDVAAASSPVPPAGQFITGKITDAAGQTLPGVCLTLADGSTVITDADGNYKIPAALTKDSVTVQMMGYNSLKLTLSGTQNPNIKLTESANALATVVVETKAIKNPPHTQPEPLGGWKAYLEYIRQNAIMPDGQTGRVKLAFLVDTNGGISNIKVIRGRSEAMNNRAVAMIMNGPPWEGSSDEIVKKVKLKIRFRKS